MQVLLQSGQTTLWKYETRGKRPFLSAPCAAISSISRSVKMTGWSLRSCLFSIAASCAKLGKKRWNML